MGLPLAECSIRGVIARPSFKLAHAITPAACSAVWALCTSQLTTLREKISSTIYIVIAALNRARNPDDVLYPDLIGATGMKAFRLGGAANM